MSSEPEVEGKKQVAAFIASHGDEFDRYSDAIWQYPELGCEEHRSSELLQTALKGYGFNVQAGVAEMPTAFVAKWGSGKPVIGFSCEYDALPGLSQHSIPEKSPVLEGAPGHGCGHNLLGVGSMLAAVATKQWLAAGHHPGTVVVLGTPAEEICVGKPFMARAGLFEGFDAILDWHPGNYTAAQYTTCNAYFNIRYHFKGRTAHGNVPWLGRSAMDGALLMGHAIELLREHIPPGITGAANTINYTFSHLGPEYPNVVSDRATVWVVGRITTAEEMEKIIPRICRCAEGAATATGTAVHEEFICASHDRIPNKAITEVMDQNLRVLAPLRFNEAEQAFAGKLQETLGLEPLGMEEAYTDLSGGAAGVSDNAEYSWFAPFSMLRVAVAPAGVGLHNWQSVAAAGHTIGKKAMKTAASVLAASAVDLMARPELLAEAGKEFREQTAGRDYRSLIPSDVEPPLTINRAVMEKYLNTQTNGGAE